MARHLVRNVTVMLVIAIALLTIFEASGHQAHVLPADASPGPVLGSAVVLATLLTAAEQKLRRHL